METFKLIPNDLYPELRKAIELVSQYLVLDWNKGQTPITRKEWNDVELEKYLRALNLNQKAVLYAAAQLKEPKKVELLKKINGLLISQGKPKLNDKQFTGVKSSLTKHFMRLGKEELIPSKSIVKDYFRDEKSRYKIEEKYRQKIKEILSNYFK